MAQEILQRRDDRVLVRAGDVVRHPQHPWSEATRMLLRHLEAVGFPYSPRLVGHEDEADLLSFIPGTSGSDGWGDRRQVQLVASGYLLELQDRIQWSVAHRHLMD
jgi:hypothetical protein